jgi:hypothetical protein
MEQDNSKSIVLIIEDQDSCIENYRTEIAQVLGEDKVDTLVAKTLDEARAQFQTVSDKRRLVILMGGSLGENAHKIDTLPLIREFVVGIYGAAHATADRADKVEGWQIIPSSDNITSNQRLFIEVNDACDDIGIAASCRLNLFGKRDAIELLVDALKKIKRRLAGSLQNGVQTAANDLTQAADSAATDLSHQAVPPSTLLIIRGRHNRP